MLSKKKKELINATSDENLLKDITEICGIGNYSDNGKGVVEILKYMIKVSEKRKLANLDSVTHGLKNALMLGNIEISNFLIDNEKFRKVIFTEKGNAAIFAEACGGIKNALPIIKRFLDDSGFKDMFIVNSHAFLYAYRSNNKDVVEYLVEKNTELDEFFFDRLTSYDLNHYRETLRNKKIMDNKIYLEKELSKTNISHKIKIKIKI